jgi:hypothetical protein
MTALDVITIGRSSVDLYGTQIGGRLEDMGSFEKYIGGSPTNIACGTARLGLKSAVITGVGDEHMGRFIVEQLAREGVDTPAPASPSSRLSGMGPLKATGILCDGRLGAKFPLVKGFAVGRTIFGDVAQAWMKGDTKDAEAIAEMARRFTRLCGFWDKARADAQEAVA